MSELGKIPLGSSNKISISLNPVFIIKKEHMNTASAHQLINSENMQLYIELEMQFTSIASDIRDVDLEWVFYNEKKREIHAASHITTITLKKEGAKFVNRNIYIHMSTILLDAPHLIGNKGTIAARLSIDRIEPFEITPDPEIEWDLSYSFTLNNKALLRKSNTYYTFAGPVAVQCTMGASFPRNFKAFVIFWENDTAKDIAYHYACQIVSDKIVYFKCNAYNATQSSILSFNASGKKNFYLGCDSNRKLNFGNDESSGNRFEFNCLIFICDKLEVTGSKYKLIKNFNTVHKAYQADVFYANKPEIKVDKRVKKTGTGIEFFIRMTLQNVSSELNTEGVKFYLAQKKDSKTYKKLTSYAMDSHLPKECTFFVYDRYSPQWPWKEDTVAAYTPANPVFTFGIKFVEATYAKSFKLVFPFRELISQTDKNNIHVMFKNLKILYGTSFKMTGENFIIDRSNIYHYVAITIA